MPPIESARTSSPRTKPGDPLETLLHDIWAELLARRPVPLGETFASLGGTSSLAARMLERVEQACGLSLPAAARSGDASIIQLALLIKAHAGASRPARRRHLIVRNAPGEGRAAWPDLFFLHGDFNGEGFYCLALADHIGADQPFYGFAPHAAPLPPTIEAMAADKLAALRALRPGGPYRLGGHCNGALVAFEMARRLRAGGERVERLLLVSPHLPGATRPRLSRARERIAALGAHYLGRRGALLPPSLMDAYRDVMSRYTPAAYDGPLTLLWPEDENAARRERWTRLWRRAAPGLAVRAVPGAHLTCITTHVEALGAALRDCLRDEPLAE